MPQRDPAESDVFLSFTGTDLERVKEILKRLEERGLRVFLDRERIRPGYSVSQQIEGALRTAKVFVVYYSRRYAKRWACQFELTQAFVADATERSQYSRIMVVNPEVDKQHVQPVELTDRIYLTDDGSSASLHRLAEAIADHVSQTHGTFQNIDFDALPRSYGQVNERPGGVRRYAAMWRLHSALQARRYPMTNKSTGYTAVLAGMSGSGKTSLIRDYVRQYGYAYRSGVFWTDLRYQPGMNPDFLLDTYAGQLNQICSPGQSLPYQEAFLAAYAMLESLDGPVLWVIDNVPADLPAVVRTLLFDLRHVHTILVSQQKPAEDLGPCVELGGLDPEEGVELFGRYRELADADDTAAVRSLIDHVGGHPLAISQLAKAAQEQQGLMTLVEHVGRVLDGTSGTLAQVSSVLEDRLNMLDDDQLTVLLLAVVCAPEPLPVRFVRDTLTVVGLSGDRRTAALRALGHTLLIAQNDDTWVVHPLVRDAVRWRPHDAAVESLLAVAAAEYIAGNEHEVTLVARGESDWHHLVRHARQLLERAELVEGLRERLLRLIARFHVEANEPAEAARCFDRLLASFAADVAVLLTAAYCHDEAGEHQEAARLAVQAGQPSREASPAQRISAKVLHASALDALGRFQDADPLWAQVAETGALDVLPEGEHSDATLRWVHGRRIRGMLSEGRSALDALLARAGELPVRTVHRARLEMVRFQLDTDEQIEARKHAAEIVRYYETRGRTHDPIAVEARYLEAYADVVLQYSELWARPDQWAAAERLLRVLVDEEEQVVGARNISVLTKRVHIGQMLIFQGKARQAKRHAVRLLDDTQNWLDDGHPLRLRTEFVLGLAHQQLGEFAPAVKRLESSHTGQLALYGAHHPETLRTRFELAIALKLLPDGDNKRANALIDSVRALAPSVTGRLNDLYLQALVGASLARFAPRFALRRAHRSNHQHKWQDDHDSR